MDFAQRSEIAQQEYEKICNNPNVNQMIIQHPQFWEVFFTAMRKIDLRQNYKVEATNDSIVFTSTHNYPEATNGIYKGEEGIDKVNIELDGEHLIVREEGATINKFPNREQNLLTYITNIIVYGNGQELGYSCFDRIENVHKNYRPIDAIYNYQGKPDLSAGHALNGMACEPRDSGRYNYRSYGCRRTNGIAQTERKIKKDSTTLERWNTYAYIWPEHPERLINNIGDFAISKDGGAHWETTNGHPITEEELKQKISEMSISSSKTQSNYSR